MMRAHKSLKKMNRKRKHGRGTTPLRSKNTHDSRMIMARGSHGWQHR